MANSDNKLNVLILPPPQSADPSLHHLHHLLSIPTHNHTSQLPSFCPLEPTASLLDHHHSWPIIHNFHLWSNNSHSSTHFSAMEQPPGSAVPRLADTILQDLGFSDGAYPLDVLPVCAVDRCGDDVGKLEFDGELQFGLGCEDRTVENSSSEWMDGIMDDLRQREMKAAIFYSASSSCCFDRSVCESTQSCNNLPPSYACCSSPLAAEFDIFCCSSDEALPFPALQSTAGSWGQQEDRQLAPPETIVSAPNIPHNAPSPPPQGDISQDPVQEKDRNEVLTTLRATGFLGLSSAENEAAQKSKLLELLVDTVLSMDNEKRDHFQELKAVASPSGDSMQRLASYFADGLEDRIANTAGCCNDEEENMEDLTLAYKHLNEACPYIKFAHLTSNQAILEAAEQARKVHIIDCGILQGVQWSALLQAFASLPSGASPPKIRITGIASLKLGIGEDSAISLLATGKRLKEFAELYNLNFEFCAIATKLEDLHSSSLTLDESEVLAVNFMLQHSQLSDDNELNCLRRVLKIVRELRPKIVTVGEYGANMSSESLKTRFSNAFQYYSALFDSLDATMGADHPERVRLEKLFFLKEIKRLMLGYDYPQRQGRKGRNDARSNGNSKSGEIKSGAEDCDGADKEGRRERVENWGAMLEGAGFSRGKLSHYARSQARLLLWEYCKGFSLIEGAAPGCLSLGWKQHPIVTVSVWHCQEGTQNSFTSDI